MASPQSPLFLIGSFPDNLLVCMLKPYKNCPFGMEDQAPSLVL